jgi:hypothetical protein
MIAMNEATERLHEIATTYAFSISLDRHGSAIKLPRQKGYCMKVFSRVPMKSLLFVALALALAFAATPSARADAMSLYNVSGMFSNGQQLSGQISVNSFGIVTAYSLKLSGASNTASCSGLCSIALGTFNMGGSTAGFAGLFLPSSSVFTLSFGGLRGITTLTTNLSWSATAVPEEPALLQAMLVLLTLGLVFLSQKDRFASLRV